MGRRGAQEVKSKTRSQGCGSASVVQANNPADHFDVEVVHAFKVLAEEACCFDRRRCVHEYSLVTECVLRQDCLRKALASQKVGECQGGVHATVSCCFANEEKTLNGREKRER